MKVENKTYQCPWDECKFAAYKAKTHFFQNHSEENYNLYRLFLVTGSFIPNKFCKCGCGEILFLIVVISKCQIL